MLQNRLFLLFFTFKARFCKKSMTTISTDYKFVKQKLNFILLSYNFLFPFFPSQQKNDALSLSLLKVNGDDSSHTKRTEEQLIQLISTPIVKAVSKIEVAEYKQQS